MKRRIEIGLLYSRSGSYSLISEACLAGARKAVDHVNADPRLDLNLVPVERDPSGNVDLYAPFCDEILRDTSARHVVGCVTSWSRKEVIPTLEKFGGTLWYAVPYEGFEASDHVVYTHACPNQHLLPLLDWAMSNFGKRCYLVGSNYIWGWELNRLARETILAQGGEVVGDRYLPLGSVDIQRMVDEIRATRPSFILNSLIGPSSWTFIEACRALGRDDPHFLPETCPILSCNMTECEFPALGSAAEGLVAAGPYFRGATGWPGDGPFGSSHEASAYAAVRELGRLLSHRPGAETLSLTELLALDGTGTIDRETHHTRLPVIVAQVRDGAFRVIQEFGPLAGDPYLTRTRGMEPVQTSLRVVS